VIRRLLPGALALVVSFSSAAFAQGFPEEAFRGQRPAAGAPRAFQQPPVTRFNLPNGIEVVLVERHELPTVTMDLVFPGGSVTDPKDKVGQARVCMTLVSQGTEKLNKTAFDEAKADIAAAVGAAAASEELSVELATLTKNLDATLDLWADMLLHPGLRKEDLDRDVQRSVAQLAAQRGAPPQIAGRLRGSVYFGPNHPYGRVTMEKGLQAITVDDCKKLVKDYFKPGGARLYVVGDVTPEQVKEKVTARLAGWTGRVKPRLAVGPAVPRTGGRIFFVDVPGAPQTVISMGHAGPARTAKDFIPTDLAVDIFGGSFSSRINMNLREDKGWTYGAGGGIIYTRTRGVFFTGASVKTDTVGGSVREMVKELQKMTSTDVTDVELERAKGSAKQSLPARFATGDAVAGSFRDLQYYGLPLDYWAKYVPAVDRANKVAVRQAAKLHFKPNQTVWLIVGDGKVVLPELEKIVAEKILPPGGIVKLDADGNVLPPTK
jgi:predicted Zn-dependent peptidase